MARLTSIELLTTTIRFGPDTYNRLETLRGKMRSNHRRNPPRSELVRGIVDGVLKSKIDLSDCLDADAVRDRVAAALKAGVA